MAVEDVIHTLPSTAVLLTSIVLVFRLAKNPARVADLQYDLFRAHRTALVLTLLLTLSTFAVLASLGVALIATGRAEGWAFALLAPVSLIYLTYFVYVGKLPFQPPNEQDEG